MILLDFYIALLLTLFCVFEYSISYAAKYVKEYIEGAKPIFSVGKYWDSCNYNGHGLDYNQGIIWRLRDPQGKPPGVMQ
ncbi:putative glycosidase [Rosa chinensis]|uniref:Putative glycosidase n=1 Tax=Rosa chinensis TaxID=74649 RepID=A0A2P6PEI4_ROSCH|nr:putative glycosidase [Rosa chinensis]